MWVPRRRRANIWFCFSAPTRLHSWNRWICLRICKNATSWRSRIKPDTSTKQSRRSDWKLVGCGETEILIIWCWSNLSLRWNMHKLLYFFKDFWTAAKWVLSKQLLNYLLYWFLEICTSFNSSCVNYSWIRSTSGIALEADFDEKYPMTSAPTPKKTPKGKAKTPSKATPKASSSKAADKAQTASSKSDDAAPSGTNGQIAGRVLNFSPFQPLIF